MRENFILSCMNPDQRRQYQEHKKAQQRRPQHQQQQQYGASQDPGQPSSSSAAAQQGHHQFIMPRPAELLIPRRLLGPAAPGPSPQAATVPDLDPRPDAPPSPVARSAPKPFPPEKKSWERWPAT